MLLNEINALPERVRKYIHDLETICDPAGMVKDIACFRDNLDALQILFHEEHDHSQFLEKLLAARHGDGWEQLTIVSAASVLKQELCPVIPSTGISRVCCWHFTHRTIETYPTAYEQVCCYCGRRRHVYIDIIEDPREHGTYVPAYGCIVRYSSPGPQPVSKVV